jgi:hypothetical protein
MWRPHVGGMKAADIRVIQKALARIAGVLISRRECSKKKPRWAAGLKGDEMWGSSNPTCPNLLARVSQLGRFHWPDLDLRVAGSGQYVLGYWPNSEVFVLTDVFSLRSCKRVCRRVGSRRAEARRNRSLRCLRGTIPRALHLPE